MTIETRRRGLLLTFAACPWLIVVVAKFVTGDYLTMRTWRLWLLVALGIGAVAMLWEVWKPGGYELPTPLDLKPRRSRASGASDRQSARPDLRK